MTSAASGRRPTAIVQVGARPLGVPEAERVEVSIVMPCLNEEETVGRCIAKAQLAIARHNLRAEIVVADNGSTDGSIAIAERMGARVVPVAERGYGAALMGGIASARGEFVIMGDADDSYDWSAIYPFVEKLRAADDFVFGCRLPSGGGTILRGAMPWQNRWIGNPVLTAIGRLFFGAPVSDFHCGLRAFRKSAFDALNLKTTGMEFASEMVVKATLQRLRISEVPITLYPHGRSRPPHLRRWRDGWRHLRFMLLFCPRWLFLIPGIALCLVGGLAGTWLIFKPIYVGSAKLTFNTQLACSMAVLAGFQLVTFAAFTKVFAIAEGLLPEDRRLTRLTEHHRMLEFGLVVGVLLVASGIALFALAANHWRRVAFGELPYSEGLSYIIPAVTLITLGVQTIFSSFFLSVLGLRRK